MQGAIGEDELAESFESLLMVQSFQQLFLDLNRRSDPPMSQFILNG